MLNGYDSQLNNMHNYSAVGFRGTAEVALPPVPQVTTLDAQKAQTQPVNKNEPDTFVKKIEKEKEKKSTKKALVAGGAVLGIVGMMTLLNPKNSTKILEKLKDLQTKNRVKLEKGKQSFFKTKFGHFVDKSIDLTSRAVRATGNFNNGKDILYKNICSKKRQYNGIKNESLRKFMRGANDKFTDVMTSINDKITKLFDSISQSTVKGRYKKASGALDNFETKLKGLKSKLPQEQQKLIDEKLLEISKGREFFSESKLIERFGAQEKGMLDLNLESEVTKKINNFFNGYKGQNIRGAWKHTDKNLTLWSEDILKNHRETLEKEGQGAVAKLFGGEADKKGLYDEILDITRKHLSADEQKVLREARDAGAKKLRKANLSECVDYYDKKRDLVLGGAPTDIVTAVLGLGLGSVAIARADSKKERTAKLFGDTAFPLIPTALGVVASIIMTSRLYSGAQGLLTGAAVTVILSKLGSLANKHLLGYDEDAIHEAKLQARKEKKAAQEAQKLNNEKNIQNPQEIENV